MKVHEIEKLTFEVKKGNDFLGKIIIAGGVHTSEEMIRSDKEEILRLKGSEHKLIVCVESPQRDLRDPEYLPRENYREDQAIKLCREGGITNFGIDADYADLVEKSGKDELEIAFFLGFTSVNADFWKRHVFDLSILVEGIKNGIFLIRYPEKHHSDFKKLPHYLQEQIEAEAADYVGKLCKGNVPDFEKKLEEFRRTGNANLLVFREIPNGLATKYLALFGRTAKVRNPEMAKNIAITLQEYLEEKPTVFIIMGDTHSLPVEKMLKEKLKRQGLKVTETSVVRKKINVDN